MKTVLEEIILNCDDLTIEDGAFAYCDSLETVEILGDLTRLEKGIFNSCFRLTSLTIPESVTSIGNKCVASSLTVRKIIELNPDCDIFDSPGALAIIIVMILTTMW